MTTVPNAPRPGNLIVCEPCRCIYCIVPKVACSNWIMLLRRLHDFDDWNDPRLIYDHNNNGLTYMSHDHALDTLDLDRYFKFTFVRSPFPRLLSCYRNKFDPTYGRIHPMWIEFQRTVRTTLYGPGWRHQPGPISFDDFVAFVATQNPADMNEHWAPQTRITAHTHFPYDFVGRLEHFDRDFAAIRDHLGFDADFPTQRQLKFPPTHANRLLHDFYTPQSQQTVARTYAADFQAFGYPATLPTPVPTHAGHAA